MIGFDAVIFDMDGLLVDSESVWMVCETSLLARRGKTWALEVQQPLIGMRMDSFLDGLIAGYGLSDTASALRDELLGEVCRLIPEKAQPQPGARELIAYLHEHNIPCAIASSSAEVVIDAVVDSQGWRDAFQLFLTAEDVARGKPAPDVYLEAARRLGYAPSRCLALEDSPNGARAAVAAGITCYAVPDPSHAHPELFANITPHVFASLHDVLASLKEKVTSNE